MFVAESLPVQLPSSLVSSAQVGVWFGCLAFAVMLYRNAVAIAADKKRMKQGGADAPVHIHNPVAFQQVKSPAMKDEVDAEFQDVDTRIEKLRTHLDEQFQKLLVAGQDRAQKITDKIDGEVRVIRQETEAKVAALQLQISSMMAKDAGHDEAINSLKVSTLGNDNQIKQILQRIPKPRLP